MSLLAVTLIAGTGAISGAASDQTAKVLLSGRAQSVRLYRPAGPPRAVVVLSSGDLGWSGLVVDIAEFLQSRDVAVLGFNTRAYLASFTEGKKALDPALIPGHYEALAHEAQARFGVTLRPVLAGVSEGAGLSAVAAADTAARGLYGGVIGLGLPESIELGWNTWTDWVIWITKGDPNQPHLSVTSHVQRLAPLPLAMVQSTHDEFIPAGETRALFAAAGNPKRMYPIEAANHRFSDRRPEMRTALLDAMAWIGGFDR